MGIRDFSRLPDALVPAWVLKAREASRKARRREQERLCSCGEHFAGRVEVLNHCDATGHAPSVTTVLDPFLAR